MKSSPGRIAAVAAGLMAAGALCGGIAAAVALAIAGGITEHGFPPANILGPVAVVGAVLGAPLLPAAAFLLLRRVPLGLAFAGTTAGAALGGMAGWFLGRAMNPIAVPTLGAAVGFFAAVILLRMRFSPRHDVVRLAPDR